MLQAVVARRGRQHCQRGDAGPIDGRVPSGHRERRGRAPFPGGREPQQVERRVGGRSRQLDAGRAGVHQRPLPGDQAQQPDRLHRDLRGSGVRAPGDGDVPRLDGRAPERRHLHGNGRLADLHDGGRPPVDPHFVVPEARSEPGTRQGEGVPDARRVGGHAVQCEAHRLSGERDRRAREVHQVKDHRVPDQRLRGLLAKGGTQGPFGGRDAVQVRLDLGRLDRAAAARGRELHGHADHRVAELVDEPDADRRRQRLAGTLRLLVAIHEGHGVRQVCQTRGRHHRERRVRPGWRHRQRVQPGDRGQRPRHTGRAIGPRGRAGRVDTAVAGNVEGERDVGHGAAVIGHGTEHDHRVQWRAHRPDLLGALHHLDRGQHRDRIGRSVPAPRRRQQHREAEAHGPSSSRAHDPSRIRPYTVGTTTETSISSPPTQT